MFRAPLLRAVALLVATLLIPACGSDTESEASLPPLDATPPPANPMARALAGGGTVFVIRPSELTAEQGAWTAAIKGADYVFTTLERGPWDIPGLKTYMSGMQQAAASTPATMATTPVLLRIPPLHEMNPDTARAREQSMVASESARIEREKDTRIAEIQKARELRRLEIEAQLNSEVRKIDSSNALSL